MSLPQPSNFEFQPNESTSLVPIETSISADYYLKQGKDYYLSYMAKSRQNDLNAAIHHFQKAVEMDPNLAEAYVQLASALWEQGTINLDLAQFYCQTAIKLDATQSLPNLYLGYFLQRAGFLEDAVVQYRQAIEKDRWHSARARIALGNVLLKQSVETRSKSLQVQLAANGIGTFLTGCLLLPADGHLFGLVSNALINDAKVYTLTCAANACQSIGLKGLVSQLYRLGTQWTPQEPIFYHLLADHYLYDRQDNGFAIHYYEKTLVVDPDNHNVLKKLAKAYASSQQLELAMQTYQKMIERTPEDVDAFYQLAQICTDLQAYTKALYYYKEAERLSPNNPYVHSNMAYVLFKLDDLDGAFNKYQTAVELGSDANWLSTVYQTLGTMAQQLYHNVPEAIQFLIQAVEHNPHNHDALALLADLYFDAGKLELALVTYKSLLKIDPDNADCYSNIGYILWQMDHNDAAAEAYQTALNLDAENVIAYNNLGVIYLDELHDAQAALPLFQKALALKDDYTLAAFNAGRALACQGLLMPAAEAYQTAMKLNDINPELSAEEITSHINRLFES